MKKIERPDWMDAVAIGDQWFDEHLKDKYVVSQSEMVRVYGFQHEGNWRVGQEQGCSRDTHQAWLIGVEPIEKDSPEKVLRDLLKTEPPIAHTDSCVKRLIKVNELKNRAKKLLEEGE